MTRWIALALTVWVAASVPLAVLAGRRLRTGTPPPRVLPWDAPACEVMRQFDAHGQVTFGNHGVPTVTYR